MVLAEVARNATTTIQQFSCRRSRRRNENITPEAAQELWNHKGYVFKAIMLSKGTIELTDKEYTEVYRKYFKNNKRSSWRMMQAFIGTNYHWSPDKGKSNTPGELLEEIFEDLPEQEQELVYSLRRFIQHKNCPLNVALKIGTMRTPESAQRYYMADFEQLRNDAMLKVAEITKRESAVSR